MMFINRIAQQAGHSQVPLQCSLILKYITWIITETETDSQSDAGSTKDTTYLALPCEVLGVFYEYLWENWPHTVLPKLSESLLPMKDVSFSRLCTTANVCSFPSVTTAINSSLDVYESYKSPHFFRLILSTAAREIDVHRCTWLMNCYN